MQALGKYDARPEYGEVAARRVLQRQTRFEHRAVAHWDHRRRVTLQSALVRTVLSQHLDEPCARNTDMSRHKPGVLVDQQVKLVVKRKERVEYIREPRPKRWPIDGITGGVEHSARNPSIHGRSSGVWGAHCLAERSAHSVRQAVEVCACRQVGPVKFM